MYGICTRICIADIAKSFLSFSSDIANALINAYKPKFAGRQNARVLTSQLLVQAKNL